MSAARFTRSGVLAAPVLLSKARCRLDALRAVVVNSGNANAATGNRGLEDAARMQGAAAMAAGVHEERVAVASTGVIGVPMPMDGVMRGILAFAAIDNLWKGAASQAVQNLNVMFGRDEREGLW